MEIEKSRKVEFIYAGPGVCGKNGCWTHCPKRKSWKWKRKSLTVKELLFHEASFSRDFRHNYSEFRKRALYPSEKTLDALDIGICSMYGMAGLDCYFRMRNMC